jgi:hypothetical protein
MNLGGTILKSLVVLRKSGLAQITKRFKTATEHCKFKNLSKDITSNHASNLKVS